SMILEKVGLLRGHVSGPSNTNLVYHSSKLMALSEADYPMELRILQDGKTESDEKYLYNDMWNAHPKIDPVSGKLYWLDYDLTGLSGKFSYGVLDADGKPERNCSGTMGGGKSVMIHDLGITERYAIVIDVPVMVGIEHYATEKTLWKYDASH
ncbi:NCED4, partial [Symbiodinium pilosum]